nr:MAG TPA: hypothetical protein [Caudoviricetes sp.]
MAKIPELTADVEVIQKLGRRPNTDDGLTEAGFKAKFDEAGIAIKKFINEKVVPAINDYVVSTDGLLDRSGGTMTGAIAMSGNKVTGLGAPEADTDAANKSYVDTSLTSVKTVSVSATLTVAGWTGSAPYVQSVTITGLTDAKKAMAYPVYRSGTATNLALKEACGMVSFASRSGSTLTFTCLEDKPTVDIPVTVEVYV